MVEVVLVEVIIDDDEATGFVADDDNITRLALPDDDLSGVDDNIGVTAVDNDGTSVTAAFNDDTSVTAADNSGISVKVTDNGGIFVVGDAETDVAIDDDSTAVLDDNTGVVLINDGTGTAVVDRTYISNDDDNDGDEACTIVNDGIFIASDDFGIIEVELNIDIASDIDARLNNTATCLNIIFLTICFPNLQ